MINVSTASHVSKSFICRNKGDSQLERYFVPRYWKTDALPGISEGDFGQYELLELEPYSMEYLRVFHDFGKTMGYEHEMKIIAVQNLRLWMTYTMYVLMSFFNQSTVSNLLPIIRRQFLPLSHNLILIRRSINHLAFSLFFALFKFLGISYLPSVKGHSLQT